jgi:hypothetical protein
MTIIVFTMMTFSIVLFIFDTGSQTVHFHHVVSHIFWAVMLIHTIQKAKSFARLFKDAKSFFANLAASLTARVATVGVIILKSNHHGKSK